MPKVTVLMPVYNVGRYIQEAIDSVLKQTFTDFTLLVMDDCSTDNTAEIVKTFTDRRIRYEKNEHNLGLAENLNRGIELSDTEFIARMDGDDIALPIWLEREYDVMINHPDVDICGTGFRFFGTKKSVVMYPKKHDNIKAQMLFGCPVIVPMFRRSSIIDNELRYKTSAFPAEDYQMWVDCIQKLRFQNIREILFYYRMHASQISTAKRDSQIMKSNEARLSLLQTLSSDINDGQKEYYLNNFVPAKIHSKNDVKTLKAFSKMLLEKNGEAFNTESLRKKFNEHISTAVYHYVIEKYFVKGYTISRLFSMINDGYVSELPLKLLSKIVMKSLLLRKA